MKNIETYVTALFKGYVEDGSYKFGRYMCNVVSQDPTLTVGEVDSIRTQIDILMSHLHGLETTTRFQSTLHNAIYYYARLKDASCEGLSFYVTSLCVAVYSDWGNRITIIDNFIAELREGKYEELREAL